MIEAVIFDLDGVLVSTDDLHYQAWKALATLLGINNFDRKDNERQRGVSRMASLEVVLEKSQKIYSTDQKFAFADSKNAIYVKSLESLDETALLPGALDTLKALKSMGIKIALGSASKNAPLILEKTGISSYFDAIACGHDVTRSKPDPEVFQVAAKKLKKDPDKCLVVEDAMAGVDAAISAGMGAIGVGGASKHEGVILGIQDLSDDTLTWEKILRK